MVVLRDTHRTTGVSCIEVGLDNVSNYAAIESATSRNWRADIEKLRVWQIRDHQLRPSCRRRNSGGFEGKGLVQMTAPRKGRPSAAGGLCPLSRVSSQWSPEERSSRRHSNASSTRSRVSLPGLKCGTYFVGTGTASQCSMSARGWRWSCTRPGAGLAAQRDTPGDAPWQRHVIDRRIHCRCRRPGSDHTRRLS